MISRRLLPPLAAAIVLFAGVAQAASDSNIKHVLLISVDGLHALDVANYVQNHPGSALAELASHGVTFSNARTPANSDSFPGLMALVTGGSPVTTGLFYDVSYDRTILIRRTRPARVAQGTSWCLMSLLICITRRTFR